MKPFLLHPPPRPRRYSFGHPYELVILRACDNCAGHSYYGFRLTQFSTYTTVEASTTGSDLIIRGAVCKSSRGWHDDCACCRERVKERDLCKLPHAGATVDEIRSYIAECEIQLPP